MARKLLLMAALSIVTLVSAASAAAQAPRKSVSGAEVTGTFSRSFTGKFRDYSNEIKIQALGKGKLKIAFDLVYPFTDGNGDPSAHIGQLQGKAEIKGDRAVFSSSEFGSCTITVKFVRRGSIRVTQQESVAGCGFGHNVTAEGVYRKTSGAKPKFEEN